MPDISTSASPAASDVHLDRETLAALVAIALLPVWRGITLWTPSVVDLAPDQRVILHLFDLPVAVLVGFTVIRLLRAPWTVSTAARLPATIFALLIAWSFVATARNPSWLAVQWYFHVAAAVSLALCIARSRGMVRVVLLTAISGFAAVQAVFGVAQSALGRAIGLEPVEGTPVLWFGSDLAAIGSYLHPYRLATLLLAGVVAGYVLWFSSFGRVRVFASLAIAISGFALPFTFSRASLLALGPMVLLGLTSRRLDKRPTICLVAMLLLGGLFTASGWTAKADRSIDSGGRGTLSGEAADVIADHPVFGVGTGRYVIDHVSDAGTYRQPPHNFLLHIGGELGVPGLILAAALLAAAGWWVLTGGRLTMLSAAALLPLFMLDWFPYAHTRGILVSGLWWGCVTLARRVDADLRASGADREVETPTTDTRLAVPAGPGQ